MSRQVDRTLSKYCHRFGMIAVDQGFVTAAQLKEAMNEQIDDGLMNRPHRIVGRILLDRGWMTYQQIERVMNELFRERETYRTDGLQGMPRGIQPFDCRG